VSRHNLTVFRFDDGEMFRAEVERDSANADLVIMGLTVPRLSERGVELVGRYPSLRQILFVTAQERVLIE
jgi:hypothetical protein